MEENTIYVKQENSEVEEGGYNPEEMYAVFVKEEVQDVIAEDEEDLQVCYVPEVMYAIY